MKVRGQNIMLSDANYNHMVKYSNFCYDELVKARYRPNGYDMKTDEVVILKYKNPERGFASEREIYRFDSFIDAAEELLGITEEDFMANKKEANDTL